MDHEPGKYVHDRVHYLALCANGEITSAFCSEIYEYFSEQGDCFEGYFTEDWLHQFPKKKDE